MKPDVNRKKIMVAIECCSYDFLQSVHTPNIDSLDPHPAITRGNTTRAAVPALLGGFLPECKVENCYHKKLASEWTYPWFLTEHKEANCLYLYCPNGWVLELITPFMQPELKRKVMEWNSRIEHVRELEEMIADFLKIEPSLNRYFTYFHVMETHPPFYPPTDTPKDEEHDDQRQREALEYVDEALKPLIELDVDDLIVTADHGLYGAMEVFLATRIKERK